MAIYFFDSSAIVKRHVVKTGTSWVHSLTDVQAGHEIYLARITEVEAVSAITRRKRRGDISSADAAAIITDIRDDFALEYQVITVTDNHIADAVGLAITYGLRGYDAVQLAVALQLNNDALNLSLTAAILVSADDELNAAASAEGCSVENPNNY